MNLVALRARLEKLHHELAVEEKRIILEAFRLTDGNLTKVAEAFGYTRKGVQVIVKRLGLKGEIERIRRSK